MTEESPRLLEDLVPQLLSPEVVPRVLQNLLRERVSIADAASIFEALRSVLLTEYVQETIQRQVLKSLLDRAGDLTAHFLDPAVEYVIESMRGWMARVWCEADLAHEVIGRTTTPVTPKALRPCLSRGQRIPEDLERAKRDTIRDIALKAEPAEKVRFGTAAA